MCFPQAVPINLSFVLLQATVNLIDFFLIIIDIVTFDTTPCNAALSIDRATM